MKIAFYCRVDGQGFGFVLPDEADKLREFFAEHQDIFILLHLVWQIRFIVLPGYRRPVMSQHPRQFFGSHSVPQR